MEYVRISRPCFFQHREVDLFGWEECKRVIWIEHKGKKILFEDYRNLHGDDLLDVLYKSEEEFKKLTSPIPVLLDFSGAYANERFVNEFKILSKKYRDLVLKSATPGITGVKKIIAAAVNKFNGLGATARYFNDMEKAKDFLAE